MAFCDHLNNSMCDFIGNKSIESESPFEQAEELPNTTGKTKLQLLQIGLFISVLTTAIIYRFFLFRNKTGKFLDKYSQIPGPSCLPLIGSVHHFMKPALDLLKLTTDWSNKYGRMIKGKIFFIKMVAVMEPSYVKKILNLPKPNGCNKPKLLYDIVTGYTIPRGLIYSEYPVWAHHRKVISRTLLYNGVQEQLKKINFHTKLLIKNLLAEAALNNSNKNNGGISGIGNSSISKLLNTNALEVILHIIMDSEITTEAERLEFHKHLTIAKNGSTQRIRQPWLLIPPIYWLHPVRQRTNKSIAEIRKFMKTITERFEKRRKQNEIKVVDSHSNKTGGDSLNNNKSTNTKCMLEEMMDAGFSSEDIFQETLTMIYAGHETSSWATTFLLLRLALNPDIQEKCRKEVDDLFEKKGQRSSSSSLDVDLTTVDLNSLEYVDRCMKECLRLTPIIPSYGRRLDAPLELEKDLVLPKGVFVAFFPWIMHRDPEIFHNPGKFDPDRFLPEECAKRHPYSYIPFSAGVRNCLGWKVAPLTIKLVTAFILRHFTIETNDKWEDVQLQFDTTITTKKDVSLILKRR